MMDVALILVFSFVKPLTSNALIHVMHRVSEVRHALAGPNFAPSLTRCGSQRIGRTKEHGAPNKRHHLTEETFALLCRSAPTRNMGPKPARYHFKWPSYLGLLAVE
jgi:hypothetical protein